MGSNLAWVGPSFGDLQLYRTSSAGRGSGSVAYGEPEFDRTCSSGGTVSFPLTVLTVPRLPGTGARLERTLGNRVRVRSQTRFGCGAGSIGIRYAILTGDLRIELRGSFCPVLRRAARQLRMR